MPFLPPSRWVSLTFSMGDRRAARAVLRSGGGRAEGPATSGRPRLVRSVRRPAPHPAYGPGNPSGITCTDLDRHWQCTPSRLIEAHRPLPCVDLDDRAGGPRCTARPAPHRSARSPWVHPCSPRPARRLLRRRRAAPLDCGADADCPSASRCVESACVANAAPLAAISAPAAPEAHALVDLDGSGSSDPDAGDGAVTFAWTVSAVDAPCAPPVVAGTGRWPASASAALAGTRCSWW